MKIYFDSLKTDTTNLIHLSENGDNKFWMVSSGTNLKRKLTQMKIGYSLLSEIDDPGIYVIDVNGDPQWWSGVLEQEGVPATHIVEEIPEYILELVRNKKLRLVIAADKEGGIMVNSYFDCFKSTTDAMIKKSLPPGSVLIFQGNKKISEQYNLWLQEKSQIKMFDVMHSIHFNDIFFNSFLPSEPIILESIKNESALSFNSLNRVYRTHRGSHLYFLAKRKLLNDGLISGNEINFLDESAFNLLGINQKEFLSIMESNYPRFIDGDWSNINAANQYNIDIYKKTLISVITETKFDEDVIFFTEKVFKPLALGHPLILLASAGTLAALRDLGFRIDWCGIDPSYNDIIDHRQRLKKTHDILVDWVKLPKNEKISRIQASMPTIQHNFNLMRSRNFYSESLNYLLKKSEEYFND